LYTPNFCFLSLKKSFTKIVLRLTFICFKLKGKVSYSRGLHVWEIHWSCRHRGTHAVVGVATASAPLHAAGYQGLIGANAESWGWDIGRNRLYHDSKVNAEVAYPACLSNGTTAVSGITVADNFTIPDSFLVVLDMDEGTLSFMAGDQYLGVAFRGLRGLSLYPAISAVWGHCEVAIRYIGGLDCELNYF